MRSTGHDETKQVTEYKTIDGNWSQRPVAYCSRYKGYLTEKQMRVHHCQAKHGGMCGRLQNMKGERVRKMNQQQFYDKQISKMDRMIAILEKILKTVQAMQPEPEPRTLSDAPQVRLDVDEVTAKQIAEAVKKDYTSFNPMFDEGGKHFF